MSSGQDQEGGPDPASGGGRARARDTMAAMRQDFLDFFDAEYHRVVRFVMRDGAALHDAQDAAQHAFIQGWATVERGRWEQINRPRAWIRAVALKHHRASPRAEVPTDALPDIAVPGPGHAELTGQARDLVAALALLDGDARAALALHLDDIPTADIAAVLQVSEQRVRDLLKKARRTLKRHLASPLPDRRPARTPGTTGREGRSGQ